MLNNTIWNISDYLVEVNVSLVQAESAGVLNGEILVCH